MSNHNKIEQSKALLALTASALALPGIAKAASVPTKSEASARLSSYSEGDVSASNTWDGKSSQRMDIEVLQLRFLTPHSKNQALTVDFAYDHLTGASPWAIAEIDNKPKVVMSTPTIEDNRYELYGNNKWFNKSNAYSVTGGFSKEDDYFSITLGGDYEQDFNDKHSTFSLGASISLDAIEPVDSHKPQSERLNTLYPDGEQSKSNISLFSGITQVIDKNMIFTNGIGLNFVSGELSDPYKSEDKRPGSRTQLTYSASLRQFQKSLNAAHHYDFRYYYDSWRVLSFTFEYSMYKNLPGWSDTLDWKLVPNARFYTQSSSDFYYDTERRKPVNVSGDADANQSTDYRLSSFGAITLGLKLAADYNAFSGHVGMDFYNQAGSLSWFDGVENPALVDYILLSAGLNYAF